MSKFIILSLLFLAVTFNVRSQTRDLDYFLKAGLSNSPLLKDFTNQAGSLKFDSLLTKASKKPQVEAKSQLLYSPAYKNFGYDEVVTDGGNYQAVVSVNQDIFNRKEMNNLNESYRIRRDALQLNSKISSKELTKVITEQFLNSVSVYNDLQFNQSFLTLLRSENDLVKKLVEGGVYKQTDYLSLLLETQTQEILVKQLRLHYESNLRQLNYICGTDDNTDIVLIIPDLTVKGTPDINTSPLFAQYKVDSLYIVNEKAAVDLRYRLKVNWFADAGFLTSTPFNFYNHFGYSAGITLSVPIYDGQQKNIEKQKLDIEQNTRTNYRNNFKIQYSQQSRQLTDELRSLYEINSELEKQLKSSEVLNNALKSALESGLVQMTEYLNSVKNYRIINKNLNDNRMKVLQVINELNYIINQ